MNNMNNTKRIVTEMYGTINKMSVVNTMDTMESELETIKSEMSIVITNLDDVGHMNAVREIETINEIIENLKELFDEVP